MNHSSKPPSRHSSTANPGHNSHSDHQVFSHAHAASGRTGLRLARFLLKQMGKACLAGALLFPYEPAMANTLPDLGNPARQVLTPSEQLKLKLNFLNALYSQHLVSPDMALQTWLNRLGHRLAQYLPAAADLTFLVIDNEEINAFAGPGGIIGVHTGLIRAAQSEDEVAAVLAHEIAHVTQHHLLRQLKRGGQDSLATFATLLAAILVGQQNAEAGSALFYSSLSLNLQQQLAYSRAHETEADAEGIRLLAQAGFDPGAMARFFQRLEQLNPLDTATVPEILRSHPVTLTRLRLAQERAEQLHTQSITTASDSTRFELIRLHVTPQSAPTASSLQRCYQQALRQPETGSAACRTTLRSATTRWPVMWVWLRTLRSAPEASRQRATRLALARFPSNPAIRLLAAHLLMDHPRMALDTLQTLPDKAPFAPARYQLEARLHDRLSQPVAARFSSARRAWFSGDFKRAGNILENLSETALPAVLRPAFIRLKQRVDTLVSPAETAP